MNEWMNELSRHVKTLLYLREWDVIDLTQKNHREA